jgi:cysteine synthase A
LVGDTPMIKLCYRYNSRTSFIFAKCEQYNLTGSVKDRIALYILQEAYRKGEIFAGYPILEVTSGNTGISFAAIGKALGHPVKIIMPDWLGSERREIIKSMGAEVILVSKSDGGFSGCIQLAEFMRTKEKYFLPQQFENSLNPEAHEQTTAPEIWNQLCQYKMRPDAFVAGVGTGGTVMGVASYFQRQNKNIQVFPLEPAESPVSSSGYEKRSHRIHGISDEFITPMVKWEQLGKVIQVYDGDAILMAQKLARQLGLAVGISSGANIIGAIKIKEELGQDACVVSLFPDCNKKYLSTDLFGKEAERNEYTTPYIDFIGYQPLEKIRPESRKCSNISGKKYTQ